MIKIILSVFLLSCVTLYSFEKVDNGIINGCSCDLNSDGKTDFAFINKVGKSTYAMLMISGINDYRFILLAESTANRKLFCKKNDRIMIIKGEKKILCEVKSGVYLSLKEEEGSEQVFYWSKDTLKSEWASD